MRKTPILVALCVCLSATPLYASFEPVPADPRGLAMSGALAALPGDAFAMRYNPASPSMTKGFSSGAAGALPSGGGAVTTISAAARLSGLPFDPDGAISASATRFAPEGYRELTLTAGYARRIAPSIHAGLSISRMSLGIMGFPDRSATGLNAGIMAEPWGRVVIGIGCTNINAPRTGADNPLPRSTLAGISYHFDNGNLLTANAQADHDRPGRMLVAGEFRLLPPLSLMVGAGTNPSTASAGLAIVASPVRATAAVSRNIDLGTTTAFGIELDL